MRKLKFLVDAMLGHIARWLRVLGIDAMDYRQCGLDDEALLKCAKRSGRIVLTRDSDLYARARKLGVRAILLSTDDIVGALAELSKELGIPLEIDLSKTRCPMCNTPLKRKRSSEVRGIPDGVKRRFQFVYVCEGCGKVYWTGSHYDRMKETLERVRKRARQL
ncbi:MAG TPA: hypothetical protein ENG69_02860 [Candidatus Korarchaeota archaeon]|nr:hypothetical protein [Candidatus Korarchaeota archaeon]